MVTGDILISVATGNTYMVTDDYAYASIKQGDVPRKHWKLVCIVFVRPEFVESDEDLEYIFTQRGQALYTSDELSKNLVKHNEYNPTGYLS